MAVVTDATPMLSGGLSFRSWRSRSLYRFSAAIDASRSRFLASRRFKASCRLCCSDSKRSTNVRHEASPRAQLVRRSRGRLRDGEGALLRWARLGDGIAQNGAGEGPYVDGSCQYTGSNNVQLYVLVCV